MTLQKKELEREFHNAKAKIVDEVNVFSSKGMQENVGSRKGM